MAPVLLLTLLAVPQEGFPLQVEEETLDNGLRVLIVERRDVPRVFCSLWWRVGSVHERPGLTGLSHFFEHMMFMGTETIGTTDPRRDAELNAKIEAAMEPVRKLKLRWLENQRRGREPDPKDEDRLQVLQKEYVGYVEEQKKLTIPEHLSKIYQAQGGTHLNATTSYDRTNYFVDLPSNKVELFLWLESDRFHRPVFRSFYPEREVVKEERRMRTDATPTGLIHEAYWASFWQAHPYRWPVIGWMSDIDQYTLSDAQRYFETHYSPENATAIFAGDVNPAEIKALARRYFGRLKRFPGERSAIVTQEPEQAAERRMVAEADAPDQIDIRWHGPSGVHRDTAACDLLMSVFSGRSGRFHRPLVEEKKLALETESWYWSLRYGGVLHIGATPREGVSVEDVERALLEIVEDARKNGVTDRELQKAKNQQRVELARGMRTSKGIVQHLGYFETIGSYRDFFAYVQALEEATREDLKRCAERYLNPACRNVLVLNRKGREP